MNIKGTQTEKNILAALQGESMARNKYIYYAIQKKLLVSLKECQKMNWRTGKFGLNY